MQSFLQGTCATAVTSATTNNNPETATSKSSGPVVFKVAGKGGLSHVSLKNGETYQVSCPRNNSKDSPLMTKVELLAAYYGKFDVNACKSQYIEVEINRPSCSFTSVLLEFFPVCFGTSTCEIVVNDPLKDLLRCGNRTLNVIYRCSRPSRTGAMISKLIE